MSTDSDVVDSAPPEPSEPAPDPRDARIQALEAELTERTARLRSVSKAYTEQQEEMSAFRERMEAQGRLARARQEQDTVRAFFEPVQNLKRSVDAGVSDAESFLEGLRIVLHQFEAALTRLGLCAVPGIGTDFDPHLHEALAAMPVEDPEQDGKVLMVHRDGYMVGGRPVQVAQVVIGRHTPPAPPAEPEAAGEA
jgi:molecular chaperone GrpE